MVAAKRYHAQEHDTSITNDAKGNQGDDPQQTCTSEHEGYASCTELCLHLPPYVKRWLCHLDYRNSYRNPVGISMEPYGS